MGGIATDVGVALTAISAALAGYHVYVAADLSGTFDNRTEHIAWTRMSQAGIVLTCWSSFLGELQGDYARDPGPRIRQIIANHMSRGNTPAHKKSHE